MPRQPARPQVKLEDVRLVAKRWPQVSGRTLSSYMEPSLQIFTALAVSTGCLSYGICMAYTSSAIPSMTSPNSSLSISYNQASWMSK
jgi:hypothetical protein